MAIYMQQWKQWIEEIENKNQLALGGNHLSKEGIVLKPGNKVQKSPYAPDNAALAGYIIILAKNSSEAVKIAKNCPILKGKNTSVEIRSTTF